MLIIINTVSIILLLYKHNYKVSDHSKAVGTIVSCYYLSMYLNCQFLLCYLVYYFYSGSSYKISELLKNGTGSS